MNSKTVKVKNEVKKGAIKKETQSKKWKDAEVLLIVDYLADNRDFEQPTAQIYYKKFLQQFKVDATWNLVKWKVRYLKTLFGKAEKWRTETGAGVLAEDAINGVKTVNDKLNKMCPYYNRLLDIFGEKIAVEVETLDSDFNNNDFLGFLDEEPEIVPPTSVPMDTAEEVEDLEIIPEIVVTTPQQSSAKKVSAFAEKLKKGAPKDSLSYLSKFQAERNENERLKINFNKDKFKKEFKFEKKKFNAELKIKQNEIDLKKQEIERDEKLKILEMEKNERIAKYELDLKYKNN